MRYRYLTAAELDQIEAAYFYESREPGLGAEFVEDLDQTIKRILDHPRAGSRGPRNTRKSLMERFPYSVVYRIDPEEILIIALQHHSRDPRRWQERVFK